MIHLLLLSSRSTRHHRKFSSWAFFLSLSKHQLRVEQEAAMFGEVTRGPRDRQNIEREEHSPPLPSAGEGDDGVEVFLPFAWR